MPNPKLNNPVWQTIDFYTLLNRAWDFGGVREQDKEVVNQFAIFGIGPGLKFDPAALSEAQRKGLTRAAQAGFKRVVAHAKENGEVRNGWRYATNLGALWQQPASGIGGRHQSDTAPMPPKRRCTSRRSPTARASPSRATAATASGLPPTTCRRHRLSGRSRCTACRKTSCAKTRSTATPSATARRRCSAGRTARSTIYVQKDKPEGDAAGNWLPTGDGPFWLILRMYGPAEKALKGDFVPPPVERIGD